MWPKPWSFEPFQGTLNFERSRVSGIRDHRSESLLFGLMRSDCTRWTVTASFSIKSQHVWAQPPANSQVIISRERLLKKIRGQIGNSAPRCSW